MVTLAGSLEDGEAAGQDGGQGVGTWSVQGVPPSCSIKQLGKMSKIRKITIFNFYYCFTRLQSGFLSYLTWSTLGWILMLRSKWPDRNGDLNELGIGHNINVKPAVSLPMRPALPTICLYMRTSAAPERSGGQRTSTRRAGRFTPLDKVEVATSTRSVDTWNAPSTISLSSIVKPAKT